MLVGYMRDGRLYVVGRLDMCWKAVYVVGSLYMCW